MGNKPQKPEVANLGTCIIEHNGPEFLVMFADGTVRPYQDYPKAVKAISKYFASHTPGDCIGVGQMTSYDGSIVAKVVRNGYIGEI